MTTKGSFQPNVEHRGNTTKSVKSIIDAHNGSTCLTWFWSLVFGPFYFAVYGFWGAAILSCLTLNFLFICAPFVAYDGWKKRAREEAAQSSTIINAITH